MKVMTGQKLELILEFTVILLAPIVYHFYLWKFKKIEIQKLIKNIKVYVLLYGLIAITYLFLIFK
jgi:Trk-type K+ transport system membrane component